jgi:hypothetical protein
LGLGDTPNKEILAHYHKTENQDGINDEPSIKSCGNSVQLVECCRKSKQLVPCENMIKLVDKYQPNADLNGYAPAAFKVFGEL